MAEDEDKNYILQNCGKKHILVTNTEKTEYVPILKKLQNINKREMEEKQSKLNNYVT